MTLPEISLQHIIIFGITIGAVVFIAFSWMIFSFFNKRDKRRHPKNDIIIEVLQEVPQTKPAKKVAAKKKSATSTKTNCFCKSKSCEGLKPILSDTRDEFFCTTSIDEEAFNGNNLGDSSEVLKITPAEEWMDVKTLRANAKLSGIKGYSKMNRQQLVDALYPKGGK